MYKYRRVKDGVAFMSRDGFDVKQTLECGQAFRYKNTGAAYRIIARGRAMNIEQDADEIIFSPCTADDFENIWVDYFDLETDYTAIKRTLSRGDAVMERAAGFGGGIRLLNQERWETLVSFIVSQRKSIPAIQTAVSAIAAGYGGQIGPGEYAFPGPEMFAGVTTEDLNETKTGYRAAYIADAAQKVNAGALDLNEMGYLSTDALLDKLMTIKGVGPKVANCVALFSFGRRESFPVDVWVERAMRRLYFNGEKVSAQHIKNFAAQKFGGLGGYAQQYLFYYMRGAKSIKK